LLLLLLLLLLLVVGLPSLRLAPGLHHWAHQQQQQQ
jgi:hypothetical protein